MGSIWLGRRLPAAAALCGALWASACTGTIGGASGTPSDAGAQPGQDSGAPVPVFEPLHISEIMYHPVLEEDFEDWHEFVELYNPHDHEVSLEGWSLAGGITYAFPAGARIPAAGYLVVAKSRDALLAVEAYALEPDAVLGDYQGSLDNGGDTVALQAPDGTLRDVVSYDDAQPWPVAADALGVGQSWLDPSLLPLEQHRYLGRSLERVSFAESAAAAANWVASSLDGATPGRPNSSARAVPLAVVDALYPVPVGAGGDTGEDTGAPRIRAEDTVRIQAHFSHVGALAPVVLEYYVDDVTRTDEAVASVSLVDDGSGGDEIAGDRVFSAVLPPQPAQSIVRYRVRAEDGSRAVSPRPGEPFAWHAYFVEGDEPAGKTRAYHLFIAPADWTAMWTTIQGGRVAGCEIREEWNRKVPAVFVYEGKVYDVRVRHQGSRYNRTNGEALSEWPYPGPSQPAPVRALSWRIAFPRYAPFGDRKVITLKKLKQSCPGLTFGVGFRLFAEAGLPTPEVRYARLFINGGYYHYTQEIERPGAGMLARYHEAQGAADGEAAVGHLFKATGCNCDEGPYTWADGHLIEQDYCNWTPAQRYTFTYDRKTHEWADHDQLIALIEGMHAARAQGTEALRAYLADTFDLKLMLSYLAVMNWAAPFDDMFHNYYLYQRREDGKWILAPWDMDLTFGGRNGASTSLYVGEENDPDNRNGWWNYFKDSFLRAYRTEFEDRIKELNQTLLHPDKIKQIVDEIYAAADPDAAAAAPAGTSCDYQGEVDSFKRFVDERHQVIIDRLH